MQLENNYEILALKLQEYKRKTDRNSHNAHTKRNLYVILKETNNYKRRVEKVRNGEVESKVTRVTKKE